ncbi:UNVERIFIED_CONTAM: hypothetical protein Slati_1930000 [Sesamum latifolium]|uniref:Reverse transcriptase Ty1/copia-type domain-containing protein n=1 Tax=Sesamum latifolium TaxID=2727402 RepID=A0AAW2X510_9LAMI
MTNEIQNQYDRLDDVPSIMLRMKEVYAIPDRHIRYAPTKAFFGTKMAERSSVQSHGVKMFSLVKKLEDLKARLENDTYIDMILQSLPPSYDPFIVNYNMNGLEKSIHELINMLVQYEATNHKSEPAILVGEASTSKGKRTVGGSQLSRANDVCMHPRKGALEDGISTTPLQPRYVVVEVNMISNVASWVLDTGCGAHICNNLQVLERSKKLRHDEMILRLGDGKGEFSYFITFTDDHSRYGYVYLMRIKALRSDRGDEYLSGEFIDYLKDNEILSQRTPPGMLQLNRVAERRNRTVVGHGSVHDEFTELPPSFWGYALEKAAKLPNIAPSKTVPQMHGKPAFYKYLRVWGSPAYVKRLVGDKLDSRSSLCSRRDEVLLKESSEEPQHDSTTSFEPPVLTDSVPVLCRSTMESRVPERDLYGSAGGFHYCWRRTESLSSPKVHLRPQASFRSWNTHFDEVIRGYDFIKNEYDPCVYKKINRSSVAYLVLYVDNILLIGNNVKVLGGIKAWLSTQFSMKDMGEPSYILGINICRDRSRRILGYQSSYIEKVLKRFKMENSKRGLLPMRHGVKLSKKQSPKTDEELKRMSNIPYASTVGSIQYVPVHQARYRLRFERNKQISGMHRGDTLGTVKSILKYLKRTKDMFLIYGGGELILEGYSDASFQSDDDDVKSQSGFILKLNIGVVAWKISKQDTTADSTMEAEYIAASEAAKKAV